MNLKKLRVLFIVLVLAFSITSCGQDEESNGNNKNSNVKEEAVEGGEIDLPVTNVKGLNPLLNSSSSVYYFNKLIFEGLFEFDKNLEPKEQLVQSYNINIDGSIDITLKSNVSWHDGVALSSKDVKFTIDTIKYALASGTYIESISDMYKPEGILDFNDIASVEVKDQQNLTINFASGFNNILETLTFPIIPAHAFDENYEKALEGEEYVPIGTGPYKQETYEKLKFINLKDNNQYWGQKPNVKKIKGRILKDEELSLTSFESGQMDIAFSLDTNWDKYSQEERVKKKEFPSRRYEFLAINAKSNVFQGEIGNAIKKAIAYGIDRENIINKVYLGHATLTNTPINPKSYLTSKEINSEYKYNVKKARKILEECGFLDLDNDTMYEDENGNPLSVKLTTNSYNDLRVRTLEIIAEDLKSIGINVEKDYEVLDTEGITDEAKQLDWNRFESKMNSGSFEIALLGWETSFKQDISNMFHSSSIVGKNNFIGYENPELDIVLDDIGNSINKEDKKRGYIKAQEIIIEDLPYISLFFTNGAILSNIKVHGEISPSYTNIYNDIDKWFIPKKYQTQSEQK